MNLTFIPCLPVPIIPLHQGHLITYRKSEKQETLKKNPASDFSLYFFSKIIMGQNLLKL